jgi:hypothetical protein
MAQELAVAGGEFGAEVEEQLAEALRGYGVDPARPVLQDSEYAVVMDDLRWVGAGVWYGTAVLEPPMLQVNRPSTGARWPLIKPLAGGLRCDSDGYMEASSVSDGLVCHTEDR